MKEVEWHVAKLYDKKHALPGGKRIDLWDGPFKTQRAAERFIKDEMKRNNYSWSPFVVVKSTLETKSRIIGDQPKNA